MSIVTRRDPDPMAGTWMHLVGGDGTSYSVAGEYSLDGLPEEMAGMCIHLTTNPAVTEVSWNTPTDRAHFECHTLQFRPSAEEAEECPTTLTNPECDLNFPAHEQPRTASKSSGSSRKRPRAAGPASTQQTTQQ